MERPLAALGGFLFSPSQGSYEELSRRWTAVWATHEPIGTPNLRQFMGAGDRELSIYGGIWPELQTAGTWKIEDLGSVAESGRPLTFILASGIVLGRWCLEEVIKDERLIEGWGYPGEIGFELRLTLYAGGFAWPF